MKNYFSMTEGVYFCLLDNDRSQAFRKAIKNGVREGDIVADLGGGSGILSLFAAEAGAGQVYCVENDPRNAVFLEKTFVRNGFADRIQVIHDDATRVILPASPRVLICEMIATALIEELQVSVMNHVLPQAAQEVTVIPAVYECRADLVSHPKQFYGFTVECIRYDYSDMPDTHSVPISETQTYASVDFTRPVTRDNIQCSLSLVVTRDGTLSGIRLSGLTRFPDGNLFVTSPAYSYPIILPVDDQPVRQGDRFNLSLSYRLCGGLETLQYRLDKE
jgi:type I protein arginine methyltransferase